MADKSKIEWTEASWNPIRGCSRVSEGCRHCYAEGIAARFSGPGMAYEGLARIVETPAGKDARWTNEIAYAGDQVMLQPIRWRRPRKIFVNSMSDLFHENVPDEIIDRVFAVMTLCPQHTFQILTKRPERMRRYFRIGEQAWHDRHFEAMEWVGERITVLSVRETCEAYGLPWKQPGCAEDVWPLPNVWMGVSVEDQVTAETRIPYLLDTPAAIRFLSCEPLLGPIDLGAFGMGVHHHPDNQDGPELRALLRAVRSSVAGGAIIDWVIAGGESGHGARPMHPDWVRGLRDQCAGAGVPFFFKQWGNYVPMFPQYADEYAIDESDMTGSGRDFPMEGVLYRDGYFYDGVAHQPHVGVGAFWMEHAGKKSAGRTLDGRIHGEFPEVDHA